MKICPKCKTRPRNLPDSYCKKCRAEYQIKRYRQNPKYLYEEKKEWRKNNKPLLRKIKKKWFDSHREEQLKKLREYGKIYRKNNKEKIKAHYTLNNAIKRGEIVRQPCEICGNPISVAHHEDYTKPFEVTWLCRIHHGELHYNS
jgi:hypothetical protein